MKHPKLIINIPEPCHEDWNKMTPTQKGKFCNVCTKEVIDFTSESDEAIVNHYQKNTNVCGRFYESQLDRELIVNRKQQNHWLSYVASLLLPAALFSQEMKPQTKTTATTTQSTSKNYTSLQIGSLHKQGEVAIQKQTDSITVSGIITDDTGLPLPGATIQVKNSKLKTTTDFDGNYEIVVKKNSILEISYIGYESVEKIVKKETYNVSLVTENSLELVAVTGYGVIKGKFTTGGATVVRAEDIEHAAQMKNSFFNKLFGRLKKK